jgi:thioredoxin reductase (NADPH)
MEQAEVAVIGAGPIGLETAVALRRAGVPFVHLEAGAIGATMGWWAPGTRYFSSPERIAIAGVPLVVQGEEKATREDYLRYLRQVAGAFALEVRTFERVVAIEREGGWFVVRTAPSAHGVGGVEEQRRAERLGTDRGLVEGEGARSAPPRRGEPTRAYRVRRIVLAIGNMHLPRMVGVPGEGLPHVSHYLEDPHKYFGKRVVIVGGRNSAAEAAVRLYRAGASVTLCQRRPELERERIKYWLLPELEWLIGKGLIGFEASVGVREITEGAVVFTRTGGYVEVPADMVLLLTGYVQEPGLFEMLGVELHGPERRPRFNHDTMETSVPGVFVAGTAVSGSQERARVFIENAHEHVERIVRAITGKDVAVRERAVFEGNEES